jgi:hypothetical protein
VQIEEQEESKMTKVKVKIDGEELEMEKDQASHVEKLLEDLRNLEDEKDRVEREMDMIKKSLEKAEGERDAMEEKVKDMESQKPGSEEEMEEKMDGIIRSRVRKRVALEKVATRILPKEVVEKLDSMEDLEIKKEVIKSKGNSDLEGRSEVYIDAAFDIVTKTAEKATVKATPTGHKNLDSRDIPSADEARKKMIERQTNPKGGK